VTAAAGDFRFAATNIGMNLGGFGAAGNVAIGRAQGVVYGKFDASFAIGSGDVGGTVYVGGSFDTAGNFSFTGSGSLNLVAFGASVSVSGSKSGSNWSFSMSSNITVMGAVNVGFSGNFYKSGSQTRFTMRGSAALNAAGVAGSGSFRISNEPGQSGMYVDVSVNVGGIVSGSGAMWVGANGSFNASIYVYMNLRVVGAYGYLYISNNNMTIDAYLTMPGTGINFRVYGYINANGSFQFTASAGSGSWSTYVYAGIAQFWFGASWSSSITITSWAPYVSVSVSGSAYLDASWPSCWWNYYWYRTWFGTWWKIWYMSCGWGGRYRWINAGIGFNTNPGNIWVNLNGYYFGLR
jgi:hypothetical protein